jgi:PAS domain S-box-containing protein
MDSTRDRRKKEFSPINDRTPGDEFLRLLDAAGQGVIILSSDSQILAANTSAERLLGFSIHDLRGRRLTGATWKFVGEDGTTFPHQQLPFVIAQNTGKIAASAIIGIYRPGVSRCDWVKMNAQPEFLPGQENPYRVCVLLSDISQQKLVRHQLNERIKELQAFYALSEVADMDGLSLNGLYQRIVDILPKSWQYPEIACCRLTIQGKSFLSSGYSDTPWKQTASITMRGGHVGLLEMVYLDECPEEDEGPFLKEERMLLNSAAERIGHITERRQAVDLLQQENQFNRLAMQALKLGKWQYDSISHKFYMDETARLHFGFGDQEIFARDILERIHPEDVDWVAEKARDSIQFKQTSPIKFEFRVYHLDGSVSWLAIDFVFHWVNSGTDMNPFSVGGTSQDITERKIAVQALQQKSRSLYMLSTCNQALVKISDETDLLNAICRICVENGGYRMAWVGFAEQNPERTIRPVAQSGMEDGYLDIAEITWMDVERGRGPTGTALRTNRPSIAQNIQQDPRLAPWREAAAQRGCASSIALPLNVSGKVIGVLTLYAHEPDAFEPGEVDLLTRLANDLSFGIESIRARARQISLEQELIKSEGRYRLAQQSAHIGSWEWDMQKDTLYWSEEMYLLFDKNPFEFNPSHAAMIDCVVPEDRQRTADVFKDVHGRGDPFDIECRILDSDGHVKWVNAKGNILRSMAGEPLLTAGTMQDITHRKQVEEALQQRLIELETVNLLSGKMGFGKTVQELLQILLEETLKSIHSQDGCIFLFNPSLQRLEMVAAMGWFKQNAGLTLPPDEGINGLVYSTGQTYLTTELHNDPLPWPGGWSQVPPEQCGGFFPIYSPDGCLGVIDILITPPRRISENEQRLLAIISQLAGNATLRARLNQQIQTTNLDLQKEIEQRAAVQNLLAAEKELLSTTLMSIAEGVIIVDEEGRVMYYNQAAETISGYQAAEVAEKPLESVFRLIDPNTQQAIPDPLARLYEMNHLEEIDPNYKSPLLVTKSEERIPVSGSIAPIKSLAGELVGHVLVFQNIAEKLKAEAQMLLSQKMEAVGQLAAGIAHEINTPIQYIGDNLRFLQKMVARFSSILDVYQKITLEAGRAVSQEDVDAIEAARNQYRIQHFLDESPIAVQEALNGVERVRKIVLAMREFSHPSEKQMKPADINHGIETTIIISRNEWKYIADLETDLDGDLPLVSCQIDEINQVILNMIINAAQAIQERIHPGSNEKGKILIQTRKSDNKVLINIQDTGKGIPEEILPRIFEPFFTTKGVGKGTGQGLSMAHNIIVNKHKGRITVTSKVGQGTTFTMEIPMDPWQVEE